MEVRIQRAPNEFDRAMDAIGARAAGPLVEEYGGARGGYGRTSSTSAACSSVPVRKYRVSSLVYR